MSTNAAEIEIVVNGVARRAAEGETILGLIRALELDPERLAVELDREIVRRADWGATELRASARLEIVMFVGGG